MALFSIIVIITAIGCDRGKGQLTTPTITEDVIRRHSDEPVGQSAPLVAGSMAGKSIFVATDVTASTEPTQVVLNRLRFRTANDNQGRRWAYAYTSAGEFTRAYPRGSPYVELTFADFFHVIDHDSRFARIYLNAGSDAAYALPREMFAPVSSVVR